MKILKSTTKISKIIHIVDLRSEENTSQTTRTVSNRLSRDPSRDWKDIERWPFPPFQPFHSAVDLFTDVTQYQAPRGQPRSQGPISVSSSRELFRPAKPVLAWVIKRRRFIILVFSQSVYKNRKVYTPQGWNFYICMKGTSRHTKNTKIKQPCNHRGSYSWEGRWSSGRVHERKNTGSQITDPYKNFAFPNHENKQVRYFFFFLTRVSKR